MAPKDLYTDLSIGLADRFVSTGGAAAAESVSFDGQRYFVTNAAADRIDVFAPGGALVGELPLAGLPGYGGVSSVAARGGVVAVAVEAAEIAGVPQRGFVALFDATTLSLINLVTVGFQPDHVTFSHDGSELYVANEGEPRAGGDPRGSVSIVTFPEGFDRLAEVSEVDFAAFDGQEDALREAGVRLFPGKAPSVDLEPEYIAVDKRTGDLFVTLQEANTVARIDRATLEVTLLPQGVVDNSAVLTDFSDRDGGIVFRAGAPVSGLRMADAIATFERDGTTYYVTANEGDDRGEDVRVGDVTLDPTAFPDAAALQDEAVLGRLNISSIDGDVDGDGDFDALFAYGGRSFTVYAEDGTVVFDSRDAQLAGLDLEFITALLAPSNWVDDRADNKGPEPEGVAVGEVDGRTIAAIGAERSSAVFLYDLTDLGDVGLVGYIDGVASGDVAPEVLTLIAAGDSPSGLAQLAVAYEVSGTTAVYDLSFGEIAVSAVINEFLFNPAGTDENEFAEVLSTPGADLSALWLLQIEGDGANAGVVDTAIRLDTADADGYWWTGFQAGEFENGAATLLLVEDFSGAEGDDLDADNDGALDATPWARLLDGVATKDDEADLTYAEVTLDDVVGASRIPDGTDTGSAADWVENDADLAGITPGVTGTPGFALNTPLAANAVIAAPPPVRGFELQVTEIWPGNEPGANLTEDWFEVTNVGSEAWTAADGDLFFDDDSRDPANAARLLGVAEIAPGESVVFVDGGAAGAAEFTALWDAAVDLGGVRIGAYDGPGLSQGGDAVTLFLETGTQGDGVLDDGEELDFEAFPDANADGGQSWDVVAAAFSQPGVGGAVATPGVNDEGQPAVGSPGEAVPGGGAVSAFTLELLHIADQEASSQAVFDAPRASAVFNALEAEDLGDDGLPDNTLRLSSGDAILPGLFFQASEAVFGSAGIADIQIQNELGLQAIAFGNHEFDFGPGFIAGLIDGSAPGDFSALTGSTLEGQDFEGADFPYLSSNLDFSTEAALAPLAVPGGQPPQPNVVAASTVITLPAGGEKIGVVGATTPTLDIIANPGDLLVLPEDFDGDPTPDQLDALAAVIQAEVDALLADNPDMNKVILLAHMQQIAIEQELAARLTGVDIVVAGGSNTRLLDETDRLRDGDTRQGDYPIFVENAGGTTTAVVNTDGSYKYVGRLVIDFDADGNLIAESYDPVVSGAYATDAQGVADLGAEGLVDPEIQAIADAIGAQIAATESNVFGVSEVYLEGRREVVRVQETNLGNLTADANLAEARKTDPTVLVSLKNGGGIRDDIGQVLVPPGGSEALLLPNEEIRDADGNIIKPEGGISQNDIGGALRFNNGLTLLSLTTEELRAVLEYGVAASTYDETGGTNTEGRFPQVAGVEFSFDPDLPAGEKIVNARVVDETGETAFEIVRDGTTVDNGDAAIRIVTLNFLAGGGDGYPFPTGDAAQRVDLTQPEDAPRTGAADFAPDASEQDALAEYLAARFLTTPFAVADTPLSEDGRIQNLNFRADAVFGDTVSATAIPAIQGAGHVSPLLGTRVATEGVVTHVVGNGFYLQDATGDGDEATSDAIFVFAGSNFSATGGVRPAVGDLLAVEGVVGEFTPGGAATRNLSTTQIGGDAAFTVLETGVDLPAATVIGAAGRVAPSEVIDSGPLGANFDPANDGIDFFESLEAMRVTVDDPLVVAATNRFGEIFTVADGGAGATGLSERSALTIAPGDFNPEKVQIQFGGDMPAQPIGTGALLDDATGVVSYAFGNFEVLPTEPVTVAEPSTLAPSVSTLAPEADRMTVASYNVLNLDPNDGDGDADVANGRFAAIAAHVADALNGPDVVALQEIQDDSGSADDGVVSAEATLALLVAEIAAAGGPAYTAIDNPFIGNNTSGGQPGGNIRTAYLYNPERVDFVEGSLATIGGQGAGEAFFETRLPLVAEFTFGGETVTVVNNHFSSKGGSAAILGVEQPFDQRQDDPTVNGGVDERQAQAEAVKGFVDGLLDGDADAKVVVLGDLNEFEFNGPVETLAESLTNLVETLPREDRSSFTFQGNAQVLDHILVSEALAADAGFEFVPVNADFVETETRASDHDPVLASLGLGAPAEGPMLTVIASGTGDATGVPSFEVIVDGVSMGRRTIETPQTNAERHADGRAYDSFVFALDAAPESFVSVVFDTDRGPRGGGEDVNLFVDGIVIGDDKFESEVDGVFTRSNAAAPERNGPREALFWNGELRFDDFGDLMIA